MKLYSVFVTVELELPIAADSPKEAEVLAQENWKEEIDRNYSSFDGQISTPREIVTIDDVPKDWIGCGVYSNSDKTLTLEDILPKATP